MKEWLGQSAAELGRGIGAGQIDPVDLTRTYLDAIDSHRLRDNIFARVTHDRAMAEAQAAAERARTGHRLSPLDGVPISWKDLFDTAGIMTEAGSHLLKDRVPDRDAEVLRKATDMGLVCLGKTHMSELAYSGLGINPVTGTPPCVNDEEAAPGGSSSGAAASVAYWLSAAGIGSDTGGSVRLPAAWNDLVGLKTTSGRLPLTGVVPLVASFDTVGPLTRTVEDAAMLLAAMEGNPAMDLRSTSIKGIRLAILDTIATDDLADPIRAAFTSAHQRLHDAGAQIDHIEVPELEGAMADSGLLFGPEAYGTWKKEIEANPDVMFSEILARFRMGDGLDAADCIAAWQRLHNARTAWNTRVAGYDAVLIPSSANMPPNAKRLETDPDFYKETNLKTLRNTRIGNLMGLCALTIPTGVPSCGLMVMGKPMQEERLLRVGHAIEAALS